MSPARPRVLYLSSWAIGPGGQGEISFLHEQIEEMAGAVDALFLEPRFASWHRWALLRLRGRDREDGARVWGGGVREIRVSLPRFSSRVTGRGLLEEVAAAGPALAARLREAGAVPDLVHANVTFPAGLWARGLLLSLGVPYLLQEHQAPFEKQSGKDPGGERLRAVMGGAAEVVAVGEDLAGRMRPFLPPGREVRIVPEMVRTDLFRPAPRREFRAPLRLVSVGGLVERKGYEDLMRAVAALRSSGLPCEARILGEGPDRARLEGIRRDLGLEGAVHLPGHAGREAVRAALAASDILVHASRLETFGIAPAEALACGRPAVTTACGGPETYVDASCGAVVPAGSPGALAAAVREVAACLDAFDPEVLHARVAGRFGPAAHRARMLSLYEGILARGHAA